MVGGIEPRREEIPHLAVGLVLALPLLVLHHAALLVELGLGDGAEQVAHAVGLEPEREVERGGRHVLEVVGAVFVRRAVQVGGADALERALELLVVVLAPVEHQVLEQVGEAGPAGALVLRADVIPDVDRDDRRLVVLVDEHGQAVRQHEPLVGDVDGGLGGEWRGEEREEGDGGPKAAHDGSRR